MIIQCVSLAVILAAIIGYGIIWIARLEKEVSKLQKLVQYQEARLDEMSPDIESDETVEDKEMIVSDKGELIINHIKP